MGNETGGLQVQSFGDLKYNELSSVGDSGVFQNDALPDYFGWLRGVLNRKNIPWQMAELGKVDHGGGGTVALYLAAYGMDTIDLGPAVLSMHSPFELLSKADLYSTKLAYQAILEA